jgi:iron complex outermembrane receptor protein
VLPAPDLEPVTSTTYDAGLTLKFDDRRFAEPAQDVERAAARHDAEASEMPGATARGALELRGFVQSRRDEIGMFRTAQGQVSHFNSSEVEQRGFEVGLQSVFFEVFALHGAATYLRTEDALGKRLPMRPVWNVFARPELRLRFAALAMSAGLAAEISYRSFAFADRANLAAIPECSTTAVSASLGFLRDRLRFTSRLEDVADARCTDWVGYPLPGRALLFTLTYQEFDHEKA